MSWPSAIGLRSTSIGAPAAMVAASGFIWEMNGQSMVTPPTAAAAPVATKRKSRRVGCSAEDAVVTFANPFLARNRRNRPGDANSMAGKAAGACGPRGDRWTALSSQCGRNDSLESFYWHPCRKSASPLSANNRAMHEIRARALIVCANPYPGPQHANCALSAGHTPQYGDDLAAVRMPGCIGPYH